MLWNLYSDLVKVSKYFLHTMPLFFMRASKNIVPDKA